VEEYGPELSPGYTGTTAEGVGNGGHLATIDICSHGFAIREELVVEDSRDIPKNAQQELFPKRSGFGLANGSPGYDQPRFFPLLLQRTHFSSPVTTLSRNGFAI
jgi:hypothetical protein